MPDENEIRIPSELAELYQLAKEAFVTYEQLTQRWEVNSLARFRDTLDHLIMASDTNNTSPNDRLAKIAQAKEHL